VIAAALLDTRPAEKVPAPPQHALHQLLTAHGFTAYLWQRLELTGVHDHHLADIYLRRHPGGPWSRSPPPPAAPTPDPRSRSPPTPANPSAKAATWTGAVRGLPHPSEPRHAAFTPATPHQAVLAYADALTHR